MCYNAYDVPESTLEETTTSVPKAVSTEADAESTAAAEEENRSEAYASKTTNEKTRVAAESRPSKTPFVTTPKETRHGTETTAGSRTRESLVTTATRDKDAETTPAKGVLLCTAGDFAVEEDMFPTDGLCDLLFYTDVRFLNHEFRGRYNEKSWRTFRRLAPVSRKTGFGMSELKKFQNGLSGSQTAGVSLSELVLGIRFVNYLDEAEVKRVNLDNKILRSWAVFDAEFEDYKNVCGKGAFHRISELRKLLQTLS
ncbi:hypothetical protein HPB52_013314 [Rhipicephalus sanguineus]|uniref:Uncharacterized protein n=1 Tax=Rhipicephalus sanguineus TaxID=34632 RepID=A0A9D4PRL4_RHISA|nr:hypothetical protein HPB52_013314 [Rhipicephalus sanguineus]